MYLTAAGLYLATKKIGKNNPKSEQIQADNEMRMRWNREVDRANISLTVLGNRSICSGTSRNVWEVLS